MPDIGVPSNCISIGEVNVVQSLVNDDQIGYHLVFLLGLRGLISHNGVATGEDQDFIGFPAVLDGPTFNVLVEVDRFFHSGLTSEDGVGVARGEFLADFG